ncbi:MAG: formyltransferase family protein [Candidatus Margulisiibacteriota bacterium]|nr:formyltransferase family protein [Candidatus Margulisiibacteriota bacterium]
MPLKIALFGSPQFCEPIISTLHPFNCNILYFKLNKDQKNKIRNTPTKIVYFDSIHDDFIFDELYTFQPDYILVANFSEKVPQKVIKLAKKEALNFHPAILPQYKGPDPFFWVLRNGEEMSGITVHKLTEKWDSGDILLTHTFKINLIDTYATLTHKTCHEMVDLIKKLYPILQKKNPIFTKQNKGRYFGKPQSSDYIIRWENLSRDIYNQIRSLPVNTPAIATVHKKIIKIIESEQTTIASPEAGKLFIQDNNIYIGTGDYYLNRNVLMDEFQIYSASTYLKVGIIS